jgi:peptide deformylase
VNPVFTAKSQERFRLWDDCFSFPGLLVYLERHQSVGLRFQDEEGVTRELTADSALSELLQHEMDHLDGILAIDRRLGDGESLATREEWERRHRRLAHIPAP